MKLEVLGTGCPKCNTLEARTRAVADQLGLEYELVKVTQIAKFAEYGVMLTPALVIDGQVKVTGKLPSEAELTALISGAAK